MDQLSGIIRKAVEGIDLEASEVTSAMSTMLNGEAKPVQIATFLTALKMRGETPLEIAAAARAMRAHVNGIKAPDGCIDTCGTGGDGASTFNISTAAAFVLAACGVPVAKHGNKAVSSASGSSDVLSELGVNLLAEFDVIETCLKEIGIAFLFAQRHHPAVRHVAPVRTEMGMRTIFNLLGPLTNPANAQYQLLGVYDRALTRPMVEVLKTLGTKSAWVVCGSDGLDEITTTGPTYVCALSAGEITEFEVSPVDAGLEPNAAAELTGGDSNANAVALTELLDGKHSAYRNIVLMNVAAGLIVCGRAGTLKEGVALAAEAIDSGKAKEKLSQLIERTNA